MLFDAEYEPILGPRERALMHRALEATEAAIARLRAAEPPRILHADLHEENLFVDGSVVGVLDFDDSLVGWPVQDLGITWFALEGRDGFEELTVAFREGYERVVPGPSASPVRSRRSRPIAAWCWRTTRSRTKIRRIWRRLPRTSSATRRRSNGSWARTISPRAATPARRA